MWCFVSLVLVVSNTKVDCLERLVSEMTCYVSSETLNPTHSHSDIVNCTVGYRTLDLSTEKQTMTVFACRTQGLRT